MTDKIYSSYDFSTEPHGPCVLVTFKLVLNKDVGEWKGFRTLLAMGARFEKNVKLNNFHTCMYVTYSLSNDKCVCLKTLTADDAGPDHKKMVEDALHSMYLWMEHPEKYA